MQCYSCGKDMQFKGFGEYECWNHLGRIITIPTKKGPIHIETDENRLSIWSSRMKIQATKAKSMNG